MGNQGMTNWKFTAFLTITLMLVAGMFSNAAMASDGQGTMVITTITPGGDAAAGNATQIEAGTAAAPDATPPTPAIPAILSANGNGLSLVFTYSVAVPAGGSAINMDGGLVEIAIPSGWTVPHASVTADDGAALIATDAEGDDALKRIVLTKSGDNATAVGIKLTGDEWSVAAGETATLTITLASVTTATPSSLYVPSGAHPYREYTFRTRSMAKDGSLRSLVVADNGLNPQPRLRVGVVTAGKGQLDVSPIVYQSEMDRNISLVFTAQGPMYDYTDNGTEVNSTIAITIPDWSNTSTNRELPTGTVSLPYHVSQAPCYLGTQTKRFRSVVKWQRLTSPGWRTARRFMLPIERLMFPPMLLPVDLQCKQRQSQVLSRM